MQLIFTALLLLSFGVATVAIIFVWRWVTALRSTSPPHLVREAIGSVGISVVVEYPTSEAPLLSLLEEGYPRSEIILIADLQGSGKRLLGVVRRFRMVRVQHAHLAEVRALYRSRSRAFRRVVVVDMPDEFRHHARRVSSQVASFGYTMHLEGDSIIARDAVTYCANILASHRAAVDISLRSVVGASVLLERSDGEHSQSVLHLLTGRVLAWRNMGIGAALAVISLPPLTTVAALCSASVAMTSVAMVTSVWVVLLLSVSCYLSSEKGVFVTLDAITKNFYRFLVEMLKNNYYLYKGGRRCVKRGVRPLQTSAESVCNKSNQL